MKGGKGGTGLTREGISTSGTFRGEGGFVKDQIKRRRERGEGIGRSDQAFHHDQDGAYALSKDLCRLGHDFVAIAIIKMTRRGQKD